MLMDIDNFFDNDVIMSSLVANLNNSTVQEIVNWVTTANGCVHIADTMQQVLDFAVGKFVQTRRDCHQLVANSVNTADATQLVASALVVCMGLMKRRQQQHQLVSINGQSWRKVTFPECFPVMIFYETWLNLRNRKAAHTTIRDPNSVSLASTVTPSHS